MRERIEIPGARRWLPYYRGPRELQLRCYGSALARIVSGFHFAWPFARGQNRLVRTLAARSWLAQRLANVPFRSVSGVAMRLDIASDRFLHLSGRLPPEPLEVTVLSRLVRPGDWFVDVGAHLGLYIPHIAASIGTGTYWAIEPARENAAFLRRCFGSVSNVKIVQSAASDEERELYLVGAGSVEAFVSQDSASGERIGARRLDRLIAELPKRQPLIVKIDAEGHERAVIRGCSGWAMNGLAPIFMLEYLPAMHGQTRDDLLRTFEAVFRAAYVYYALDQEQGALVHFRAGEAVGRGVRNMLAIPAAEISRISAL